MPDKARTRFGIAEWYGQEFTSLNAEQRKTYAEHALGEAGAVGEILGNSGTADVEDAHLVVLAIQIGDGIITSDAHDFAALVGHLGSDTPKIHHWQHESRR